MILEKSLMWLMSLILASGVFFTAGPSVKPNKPIEPPASPVITASSDGADVLAAAVQFVRGAKSSSIIAEYIINATQNGISVPLFPAEFKLSYSAKLDKSVYEVTAPAAAVGSALLIHSAPTLTSNTEAMKAASAEVANGCTRSVSACTIEAGECGGGCDAAQGTFARMVESSIFDFAYLDTLPVEDAEVIAQIIINGEASTKIRLDQGAVAALGIGDLFITVRQRDGAPIRFEIFNSSGQLAKTINASYAGRDLSGITAVNYESRLNLSITLKSATSFNRVGSLDDAIFTTAYLHEVVARRPS